MSARDQWYSAPMTDADRESTQADLDEQRRQRDQLDNTIPNAGMERVRAARIKMYDTYIRRLERMLADDEDDSA